MKRTFFKNLFRDIKKTFSRFLSIVIIIAVGVAFYAGVRATSPDMMKSGDFYLVQNNFMDFKLISTLGLTEEDVAEVKKQTGIAKAEGGFSIDAVLEKDKHSLVLNINSIPPKNGINSICIIEGRMAEDNEEVVVEEKFLKEYNLKIGDEIELKSGKDKKIEDDMKNSKFKIVGSAQSPLYLSAQRQLSSVGNGTVRGFVYVLPSVFKSDVYSEIYVKIDSNESKDSLLDNENYKKAIEINKKNLEDLGIVRSKVRYDEVLEVAQNKIDEAEDEINKAKKEAADKFSDAYKKLDEARFKIKQGEAELENNRSLFNVKMVEGQKQIEDGKKQLADSQEKLDLGKQQAANNISTEALKKEFINAESKIQLNLLKIADSEIQLNKARQEGLKKLSNARKELVEAQQEINENTEKLKIEEQKVNAEIREGEGEIWENKEKLKDIKEPDWYVLGRTDNVGYEAYRQDSERIGNIGKTFPMIFFLVAALVSLTTMTRLVQENRTEIGTFKALGYSSLSIVSHYLIYSLLASLTGSIIGISFAFKLFPTLIMNAYVSLYTIPNPITPFNSMLALASSLIAISFTTIASVIATLEELREAPASLMRPKPPKYGKTILLERITFIWKRMSFTNKVTARNLLRYKQRLFMTVIGVATCTGLMITGFGLKGGVIGATEKQFSQIYKYDMQAILNKNIDIDKKNTIKDKVMETKGVITVLFAYLKNATVKDKNLVNQDVFVVVPEDKDELNKYINLTINGENLKLGENGVIITKKLSNLINKKVGDIAEITINDQVVKAEISGITEHYLHHYIYLSPEYFKKITQKGLEYNVFYGLLKSTSESSENAMSKTLLSIKELAYVNYKNNTHISYSNSMNSINSVVLILIISAGVLAFIVIYNLTNINISERKRELATIKLLGFFNNELATYIYRENVILTLIGSFAGIAVGVFMNNFVLSSAETNILMFLKEVDPIYFLYSVLLTISFSIIVNLAMYGKFNKIDMIESLKSAE